MPNALRLIAAPYGVQHQGRSRFLFVGDATQPITQIEMSADLPPEYQIACAADVPIATPFRLKILHFNDLHGRIGQLTSGGSIPVFSRIVAHYRQQQRHYEGDRHGGVLCFSAGDDMLGTPFDLLLLEQSHPYDLYQAMGVDAATLGNHDLDLGIPALVRMMQRAGNFPVLSANLLPSPELKDWIYPAALIEVKGVRIGVIGLTTAAQRKAADARQLEFADPVQVLQHLLPVLRPYCHGLIILSHLGYDLHATSAVVEGYGDRQLAAALPYGAVDLIIGGHTHHILNETCLTQDNIVNGIPIVQAGTQGRFLGEVTLTIRSAQRPAIATNAKLCVTADLPADEAFETTHITPIVDLLQQKLAEPLGIVTHHPDLRTDAVLNDFASAESALANFITAGMVAQTQKRGYAVDFALIDAVVMLTGLPAETLVYGDWLAVMPHADTLRLFQITGQQLVTFLQDNARRIDGNHEPHLERGFVQFSEQVRYGIQTSGDRLTAEVKNMMINGVPLKQQLEQTFTFVTHSFIRQPANAWEKSFRQNYPEIPLFDINQLPNQDIPLLLRDEMIDYIKTIGGVTEIGGLVCDRRLQIIVE